MEGDICDSLKTAVLRLFDVCLGICGVDKEKALPLCAGSLAKGTATPYSDLEWCIVIDENMDIRKNVRRAAFLFELALQRMEESWVLISWWNFDVNRFIRKGIQSDPGGKHPLGRRISDFAYELILTVDEIGELMDSKWAVHDKNLPFILRSAVPFKKEEVLSEKQREMWNALQGKGKEFKDNQLQEYLGMTEDGLKTLAGDMWTLRPAVLDANSSGRMVAIKHGLYRVVDILLFEFGRSKGWKEHGTVMTTFDIAEKSENPEVAQVVADVCLFRLLSDFGKLEGDEPGEQEAVFRKGCWKRVVTFYRCVEKDTMKEDTWKEFYDSKLLEVLYLNFEGSVGEANTKLESPSTAEEKLWKGILLSKLGSFDDAVDVWLKRVVKDDKASSFAARAATNVVKILHYVGKVDDAQQYFNAHSELFDTEQTLTLKLLFSDSIEELHNLFSQCVEHSKTRAFDIFSLQVIMTRVYLKREDIKEAKAAIENARSYLNSNYKEGSIPLEVELPVAINECLVKADQISENKKAWDCEVVNPLNQILLRSIQEQAQSCEMNIRKQLIFLFLELCLHHPAELEDKTRLADVTRHMNICWAWAQENYEKTPTLCLEIAILMLQCWKIDGKFVCWDLMKIEREWKSVITTCSPLVRLQLFHALADARVRDVSHKKPFMVRTENLSKTERQKCKKALEKLKECDDILDNSHLPDKVQRKHRVPIRNTRVHVLIHLRQTNEALEEAKKNREEIANVCSNDKISTYRNMLMLTEGTENKMYFEKLEQEMKNKLNFHDLLIRYNKLLHDCADAKKEKKSLEFEEFKCSAKHISEQLKNMEKTPTENRQWNKFQQLIQPILAQINEPRYIVYRIVIFQFGIPFNQTYFIRFSF